MVEEFAWLNWYFPLYPYTFSLSLRHPRKSLVFSIVFKGIFFRGAIGEEIKRVRWYVVYSPIEIGSLGIKDLETFNKLLVGQMAIEVVERKKCLWRDVLKEKYKISSWDSLVRGNFVKRGSQW